MCVLMLSYDTRDIATVKRSALALTVSHAACYSETWKKRSAVSVRR